MPTVQELKDQLKAKKLPVSGTKSELEKRLSGPPREPSEKKDKAPAKKTTPKVKKATPKVKTPKKVATRIIRFANFDLALVSCGKEPRNKMSAVAAQIVVAKI